jgi:6-phosphofructokinase 1
MAATHDALQIQTLGEPKYASPLAAYETRFVDEQARVMLAHDLTEIDDPTAPAAELPAFEPAGPREQLYFDPQGTRCGIVTCGGLCPGTNDVIRAIVLTLWHRYGVRDVLGFRHGYAGLDPESGLEPWPLDPAAVHNIHSDGGTILGSSRGPRDPKVMVDTLQRLEIDVLFTIGGDGTLKGAGALVEEIQRRGAGIGIVGIPKTIDNDLGWIERSFGFATAVNEATRSIVAAHTEAHGAQRGVGLVKLMGRHAGFIAAHATLANSSVNFCLVPEVRFDLEGPGGLLALLGRRLDDRQHAVIVVAEGAGQEHLAESGSGFDASGNRQLGDIGVYLRARIREHFADAGRPVSLKYIDPSYLIRSLPANSFDSALCLALGQHAAHAGMAGRTNLLVGTWHTRFTHVPLRLAFEGHRQIDPGGVVWQRVLEATGQPRSIRSPRS